MASRRFLTSFKDAFRGLVYVFKAEQNFRIQVVAALAVVGLMFYFPLRSGEIIVLILLIMFVLTMELLNSAVEYFTDLLKPRLHHYVGVIKDIMAAAVLITSAGALFVGLFILLPYFLLLLK